MWNFIKRILRLLSNTPKWVVKHFLELFEQKNKPLEAVLAGSFLFKFCSDIMSRKALDSQDRFVFALFAAVLVAQRILGYAKQDPHRPVRRVATLLLTLFIAFGILLSAMKPLEQALSMEYGSSIMFLVVFTMAFITYFLTQFSNRESNHFVATALITVAILMIVYQPWIRPTKMVNTPAATSEVSPSLPK